MSRKVVGRSVAEVGLRLPLLPFPVASVNEIGFRREAYAKFVVNVAHDGLCQVGDVGSACSAMVDEHEGLLSVNARVANALALPATLLDEPPCGYFKALLGGIVRHGGVGALQLLKKLSIDNGVHEKRASIAHVLRVGQLAIANVNDALAQVERAGVHDVSLP